MRHAEGTNDGVPVHTCWPNRRWRLLPQRAIVALLTGMVLGGNAAPVITPEQEAAAIRLRQGTDTFARYWLNKVEPLEEAAVKYVRAGLLKRCSAIPRKIDYLNPLQRAAVERVRDSLDARTQELLGPPEGVLQNREWLTHFALLSSAEREQLLAAAAGPLGSTALRAASEIQVLGSFAERSVDIVTGKHEPAASVWLVTYFKASGRWSALRRIVATTSPELLEKLDRVRSIEELLPEDAVWLGPLTVGLAERVEALQANLLSSYPTEVVERAQPLITFQSHVSNSMLRANDPARSEAFKKTLEGRYPLPSDFLELAWRGTFEAIAAAEVENTCPPKERFTAPVR